MATRACIHGAVWAALWLAGPALGATQARCEAMLADGVLDREHVNNTLDLTARVSGWFCDNRFASFAEATAPGLQAELPVERLLVPFGLHKDHRNFTAAYRSFCSSTTPTDLLVQAGSLKPFLAANKALVGGYLACTERGGLQLYAEASDDPSVFTLMMRAAAGRVEIRGVTAMQSGGKGIDCDPVLPGAGVEVAQAEQRYLCRRDPRQATTVAVTTAAGTRVIHLAAHAHYLIFRDEIAGDSDAVVARAGGTSLDSAPICVGGRDGNAALGNYVIDYRQTRGVRVDAADRHGDPTDGSWSFSVKEPTRACLVAHAAKGTRTVAYKLHYVFYRYRVEKDHHF